MKRVNLTRLKAKCVDLDRTWPLRIRQKPLGNEGTNGGPSVVELSNMISVDIKDPLPYVLNTW